MVVFACQTQKQLQTKKVERKCTATAQQKIDGKKPETGQNKAGKPRDQMLGLIGDKRGETAMVTAGKAV